MDRDQVLFRLFGKFCPEGTILYTEGSPGEEVYVVQSGAVRLGPAHQVTPGGEVAGPGAVLGEEAFFARTLRRQRAEVSEDCRLIQLNNQTLDAVVRHSPETALLLVERLIGQTGPVLRSLESRALAHLARRAEPFLQEATTHPIGAQDLAEQAGFGEPEARRLLGELVRRGCLQPDGQKFRASDGALLQRAVHGLALAEE